MDSTYLLFIAICAFNPLFQNVGMGLQKWSIDQTPKAQTSAKKALWIGIWIVGLLCMIAVVLLAFKALTLGNASTLGAFGGLGLIVIAVFSRFVLKEEILRQEMVGIVLIVIGTCVLGYFSQESQSPEVNMETSRMIGFFAAYLFVIALGIILMRRNMEGFGGAVLGLIAGSMNGLGLIFQKVFTYFLFTVPEKFGITDFGQIWAHVSAVIKNPGMDAEAFAAQAGLNAGLLATIIDVSPLGILFYGILMAVGGVGGFVVVQFGYKYGKAVQVVPGYASMIVALPVIAGIILLGEAVPIIPLLCVALIVAGVVVTTTAAPMKHAG